MGRSLKIPDILHGLDSTILWYDGRTPSLQLFRLTGDNCLTQIDHLARKLAVLVVHLKVNVVVLDAYVVHEYTFGLLKLLRG